MDKDANHANDASESWGEDESEVFVEFGRAMVPGREEIERTFLDLIPAEADEPFTFVEIGTGSGWLSAAVLREFPGARILGGRRAPDALRRSRRAAPVPPGGTFLGRRAAGGAGLPELPRAAPPRR